MNVFGAFTFGSLIKTFIPGFVWAIALLLVWRDLRGLMTDIIPPVLSVSGWESTAVVLAVPAIVLLGLLSNILVFMGVNDVLVRNPVKRSDKLLFALHDGLEQQVRAKYWDRMKTVVPGLKDTFFRYADAELLILKEIGLSELIYVREQYWYHMEFQVNMLLGTVCCLIGLLGSPSIVGTAMTKAIVLRMALEAAVMLSLCILLYVSALKNYRRHVAKMCALMAVDLGAAAVPAEEHP